jgi:hypothetical protein
MKRPIPITMIDKMAPLRPAGYKEEILQAGEVKDGAVWVDWQTYLRLLQKYSPNSKAPSPKLQHPPMKGMGDAVEKLAQPIAKVIDKVLGTNVQGCGGCAKRKQWLNKAIPF